MAKPRVLGGYFDRNIIFPSVFYWSFTRRRTLLILLFGNQSNQRRNQGVLTLGIAQGREASSLHWVGGGSHWILVTAKAKQASKGLLPCICVGFTAQGARTRERDLSAFSSTWQKRRSTVSGKCWTLFWF